MTGSAVFDPGGPQIGDVMEDETGCVHVCMFDNQGKHCWIPFDESCNDAMRSILICILKTCRVAHAMSQSQCTVKPKITRRKTVYNAHIGAVLLKLAQIAPKMPRKDRMRLAVSTWGEITSKCTIASQKRDASAAVVAGLEDRINCVKTCAENV